MIINFFWSGDGWTYLHDMTIKSHIKCGHTPVIWLHGNTPKSKYWDSEGVIIKNADDIVNISNFMEEGGNFKTASSLWRFTFLYEHGGWYSDTDALAVSPWPDDMEWILCRGSDNFISTGVLKVPPKEPMFLDMIKNLKYEWGNVKIFNDSYKLFYGDNKGTIDSTKFFPFEWREWNELLKSIDMGIYTKNVYSIHLYHTMFEREGIIKDIDKWIDHNPTSLLSKLDGWIKDE